MQKWWIKKNPLAETKGLCNVPKNFKRSYRVETIRWNIRCCHGLSRWTILYYVNSGFYIIKTVEIFNMLHSLVRLKKFKSESQTTKKQNQVCHDVLKSTECPKNVAA